jgi:hypothetical protein
VASTITRPQNAVDSADAELLGNIGNYGRASDALGEKMHQAVKGAGFAGYGRGTYDRINKNYVSGIAPMDDADPETFRLAFAATKALRKSVRSSFQNPKKVMKGMNPNFTSQFGSFMAAMDAPSANSAWMTNLFQQVEQALGELGKNINLTVPLTASTQGLVPYDLVNPSRLIYPVYSPFRNKLPRVQGQGTSRRVNVVTGISGSQTGGGTGGGTGSVVDISLADVPNASMQMPGGTFPVNMPVTGVQSAVPINIPYQFFGMSEALSWLSQFAGQGYEDISALANLILLQQFMLMEEYQMIAGNTSVIAAPVSAPTLTLRTAGSNEVGLPSSTHFGVGITAVNYWGETVGVYSSDLGAVGAGSVVDVLIPQNLPPGANNWNVYVENTTATVSAATVFFYSVVGGSRITIQGPTVPATGHQPPTVDSGTAGANRMLGIIPTLTGAASTGGSNYPTGVGWQAGYYQPQVNTHLSIPTLNNMLNGLWNGSNQFGTGFGAFKASPTELVGNSTDIMNLSNDIVQSGQANNYQLMIEQSAVANVIAGAAVSQYVNPFTRDILKLLVHPWWPQGTVAAMSYTVPYSWSNVSNIWEMVLVQDYLSVSWPVIDPTFRYSMFMYGAMLCNAPMYCGVLTGLQAHDTTPYS